MYRVNNLASNCFPVWNTPSCSIVLRERNNCSFNIKLHSGLQTVRAAQHLEGEGEFRLGLEIKTMSRIYSKEHKKCIFTTYAYCTTRAYDELFVLMAILICLLQIICVYSTTQACDYS